MTRFPVYRGSIRRAWPLAAATLLLAMSPLASPDAPPGPLPRPNWDRELAASAAQDGADDPRIGRWLERARTGAFTELARDLESWEKATTPSAPAREAAVFAFTAALASVVQASAVRADPEQAVSAGSRDPIPPGLDILLRRLEAWPVQTLVPHDDHEDYAVPLYNIPAAARGVRSALARAAARREGTALLAEDPDAWLRRYRDGDAAAKAGHLDALDAAPAPIKSAVAAATLQRIAAEPGLTPVAIRALPALRRPDAVVRLMAAGGPGDYATLIRDSAARLGPADRARLLLGAIAETPPERAALAIALLAPDLADRPEVAASLDDLLGDPQLGASAALALARGTGEATVQVELQAVPESEAARIVEWTEDAPPDDDRFIALGYPVPVPVDTPLPFDGFRSYAGLEARHQDLAANSPWVHAHAVGTTIEGREILAYRLGDTDLLRPGGAAEPAMLTNGGIHAREWQSPEVVTGIMELLAERQADGHLFAYLRDNVNIVVIPVLNVDGFLQTQRHPARNWLGTDIDFPQTSPRDGRMRRKNMRGADHDVASRDDHLQGIDLNRNNAPFWDTSPANSSADPESLVYHGTGPASEPETAALQAATQLGPADRLAVYTDVHSFSQVQLWVRNDNDRLADGTEDLLRTFRDFHSRYPAGKVYGFNRASVVPRNRGIGSTDEYFMHVHQVPAWTLEVEPSNDGGADYGGLARNGHDGFILPESEIRRVREQLAETFAIVYYRQSGPPAVTAMRITDAATGAVVHEAAWDGAGPDTRGLHAFTAQPLQLDRAYRAWVAFDKPMRWREDGAGALLPGQPATTLTVEHGFDVDGTPLVTDLADQRWLDAAGGSPGGFHRYRQDALTFDFTLPAAGNGTVPSGGTAAAGFSIHAFDMTGLATDADPATVARWQDGGWEGYEDDTGMGGTDTGGTDRTLAVPVTAGPLGDPFVVEPGTSSAWYDPARAGEGFVLEVLAGNRAVMYWFTYDDEGAQDWYIAVGTIAGNRALFPELLHVSGGAFGPGFDPDQVTETIVGEAEFIWSGCDTGAMSWRLAGTDTDPPRQGRMNLARLSRVLGAVCGQQASAPLPGAAVLSGSWYDPARAGEGYTVEVLADGRALVYWFSFDTEGARRWFFGVGAVDGGRLVFDEMLTTDGGVFGAGFDPAAVRELPWGALALDLDCDGGTSTYTPAEPGFPAGELQLVRLTALAGLGCETD